MWCTGLATFLACVFVIGTAVAEPIRIGAILPLTGPAARIGAQQAHGIQFAIDRVNANGGVRGDKIEVVFEDNRAQPDQSILDFNKLTDQRHVQVIFTAFSVPTLAMAPLATRKKILLINAGAQADRLSIASPYLFNTLPTISDEVGIITKYLVSQGKIKAVILFEGDAGGISARDDYLDAFPKVGGAVVAQETIGFGQTDFRPELSKLAAAKPDVMLVSIATNLANLARQYKQLGLPFTVAGTSFFQDPDLLEDRSSEGFVHSQVRIEAPPELRAEFKQKYGDDMGFHARQYYNASQIVVTAMARLMADGQPITGENMRTTIFSIRDFHGLTPLEFKTNTAAVPIDINIIRAGEDVTIQRMNAN